ncbi:MAG: low temperature requirement protein A [Acidimicrobiales bacterium]
MRGLPIPDREEDFTADPVELFFDLAFVFAFAELVSLLVHSPDWEGAAEFTLLFGLIWLPWTQFTWSANAVAGNTRSVRALFLVGTVATVPMAASVTTALDDGAPSFAIPLALILAMGLFTMVAGLADEPGIRRSAVKYSIPNWVAIAFMVIGAFVGSEARVVLWILAILVVVAGTVSAGGGEWLVRPGHFAERHGLILIVALGEIIVAVGSPVVANLEEGGGFPATTLWALVAGGTFAALLWWGYFDRPGPALEHRHKDVEHRDRGRFARDVYTYAHLPLVGGVILAAAGVEEVALHPTDPTPTAFRWMLFGGIALYTIGIVVGVFRAYQVLAIERIAMLGALLVITAAAGDLDGIYLLVLTNLVLAVTLYFEHWRVEVRHRSVKLDRADA